MRENNKGFTLIELLAVIVILAIIALITAPIILNVIEDSRKNAAVDKAWGTIDAVRVAYANAQTSIQEVGVPYTVYFNTKPSSWTDKDSIIFTTTTGGGYGFKHVGTQEVTASGENPTSGTVTIKSDGQIIANDLKFGNYYCSTIETKDATTFNSNKMYCSRTETEVNKATDGDIKGNSTGTVTE